MYSYNDSSDMALMDINRISTSPVPLQKKSKTKRGICAICGAKPTGINFDVLTCSSCKAFFRRNGVRPLNQFVCRLSGDCKIDERSRRQCTACRLKKCFAMGMIKERIRTEEQNQRHRALVQENRRQRFKKYQQQQQEETRVKLLEQNHRQAACSTSHSISNSHLNHINTMQELFIDSMQDINIHDFTLNYDFDLTNVINLYSTPISCLIVFFKQIHQFQQLSVDDRLILLKNNVKVLMPILTHLLKTCFNVSIHVTHPGLYNVNHKILHASSLFSYITPADNKLLIVFIVVFLFCPCLFTNGSLHDAGSINDHSRQLIQYAYNEYAQLLWDYILEKSSDDENRAALTYMKIVTTLLHLQSLSSEIYGIVECSVQVDKLHMMMQSILHLT